MILSDIERRLKKYEDFLGYPVFALGSFSEGSYERRAMRVALRRALQDANILLMIAEDYQTKPILLTRKKQ